MSATFFLSALFLASTAALLARRQLRAALRPLLRRAR
jgi:hypothetical protein